MFNQKEYIKKWQSENKEKLKKYQEEYRNRPENKMKEHNRYIEYYSIPENRAREKSIRDLPENKEKVREYGKNNPEKQLVRSKRYLTKLGKLFDMNSIEYNYALRSWSRTIRKLDNHKCKLCNSIKNIHAHHIQPKALFPELSLSVDNGITLCVECHSELHGFYVGSIILI